MKKFPVYNVGDLVLIRWIDSTQQEGWERANKIDDTPIEFPSCGFVYKKEPGMDHIAIAGDRAVDEEGEADCNRMMSIPLGCIKSLRVILKAKDV